MRRSTLVATIAVLASAAAGFAATRGLLAPLLQPGPEAMIAPLLPRAAGASACFKGTFTGRTMDLEDWSRSRLVPIDTPGADGKPMLRAEAPREKAREVRSFTLSLAYDTRSSSYDWIYNFLMSAEVDGVPTLFAAGECPWWETAKTDRDGGVMHANTTGVTCGIDCDGGGFDLERIAGTRAVRMGFWTGGLRMKAGCGGGGPYRLSPPDRSTVSFRLEAAPAADCTQLDDWARREFGRP